METPLRRQDLTAPVKPHCRQASYTTRATAFERLRLRLPARIGSLKGVTPRFLPTILHPDNAANPAIADIVLAMTERVGRRASHLELPFAELRQVAVGFDAALGERG